MSITEWSIRTEEVVLRPAADPHGAVESARHRPSVLLRRLLVALDASATFGGWLMAMVLMRPSTEASLSVSFAVLIGAITVAILGSYRLYLARICAMRAVEISRLGRSCALAALVALGLPQVLPRSASVGEIVLGSTLSFAFLITVRGVYRYWLQMRRRDGRFVRPVVVVGSNEEGYDLYRLTHDHPELGYAVAGVVGERTDMFEYEYLVPYLGPLSEATEAVRMSGANGVLIAASSVPPAQLNALVRTFLRDGVHVHLSSGVRGIDVRRVRPQPMAHEPMFYVEPQRLAPWQVAVKRGMDVAISVVGGIAVLPLLGLAAIAIKVQDGGPVFYRSRRVGRFGHDFDCLKLRTMVPNAAGMYDRLAATQAGRDGPLIKLANDPRRTRVGRLLERLSIDEIPQIWNVIRGEMSLVGPRPAQRAEVDQFDADLLARLDVRPGITGLWQVEARDNPTFAAYRRYDLFYLENWTVSLDLAIFVATFQRVLLRGVELVLGRKGEMSASVVTAPSD